MGIVFKPINLTPQDESFWLDQNADPESVHHCIRSSKIAIETVGENLNHKMYNIIQNSFQDVGLNLVVEEEEATLTVVICDHYLHPKIAQLNQFSVLMLTHIS